MNIIQSFIADQVHRLRLVDDGSFALNAARKLAPIQHWEFESVMRALESTRSALFRRNTSLRKGKFLANLAQNLIKQVEKPMNNATDPARIDQSVHFHAPIKAKVLQTGQHARAMLGKGGAPQQGKLVEPGYLDAFQIISKVAASNVKGVPLPLKVEEVKVRKIFEELLGESFHATDSGVESCDLMTLQATSRGKQRSVAALFKGAGNKSLRWPLQVAGCGKNGNQVVKLFEVPADIYIIQANGPLDPTLVKHIQDTADAHASRRARVVRYMLIDGISTARILRAARSKLV